MIIIGRIIYNINLKLHFSSSESGTVQKKSKLLWVFVLQTEWKIKTEVSSILYLDQALQIEWVENEDLTR
jgi:hypothetical protein